MHGTSLQNHQSADFNPGSPYFQQDDAGFDPTALDLDEAELQPQKDDIKVEYHPHSKIPSIIHHFADFSHYHSMEDSVPHSTSPWEPFRTQLDFEVAAIALEAAMTKDQTNQLFSLMRCSACGNEAFTLQSHNEVHLFWEMASERFTPFQSSVVSVTYRKEVHNFNICFTKHFVFDAQRLYKYNGRCFTSFFDEPWTANTFWDAQVYAQPLTFILYTNKSKLTSFGTQKGYPIIAQIVNLPVEILNGVGVAGGRVMGWLPIVNEDQKDSGKASFVNFKNVVWHESFMQLIESVIQHSNTGYWLRLADYEEQCIMALIHGLKGKFPCPVCLVPQDMQPIHTEELRLCTSAGSQQAREDHLKAFSLRDVENIFWRVPYCDIHRTLSWDRMHTNNGRLWSDHLWVELQFWITDLGQNAAVQIDSNFDTFQRWPDLKHFSHIMKIDFTDNATHKDISKVSLCEFSMLLDEYIAKSDPETGKNWNFPKKHSNAHPNERMHGPLRAIYLWWTNFKNVATQILRYDHWLLTSTSMHSEVDDLDQFTHQNTIDPEAGEDIKEVATHTYLGTKQGNQSFSQIEQEHAADIAFSGRVHFWADDQVTVFQYLHVNYESMVDWLKTQDQPFFACLIYMFCCSIGEIVLSLALIHLYNVAIGHCRRQDIDLGLYRVQAKPCMSSKLISIESIIRGAMLASDPATAGDYFVVDTIDTDIFLQMKSLQAHFIN
ncbi:uncharacterized protein EDB93DRAFT_1239231 [Suillus bovinus]|uniref:uncharacterized protein n=1 Tax=Suillus bovinus TaxID=48563 RepID=UPI001B87676E|nr:uncharacterized protein EDB93DRAFT_1239231 [Suillus bovinus]KAG2155366.1 hypothetical protein EDB93DRAFT_1239231 [Suillus bovinus]